MDSNYKKKKGLDWYKKRKKKKAGLKRTGDIKKKEKQTLDENGNGHKPKKKEYVSKRRRQN